MNIIFAKLDATECKERDRNKIQIAEFKHIETLERSSPKLQEKNNKLITTNQMKLLQNVLTTVLLVCLIKTLIMPRGYATVTKMMQ